MLLALLSMPMVGGPADLLTYGTARELSPHALEARVFQAVRGTTREVLTIEAKRARTGPPAIDKIPAPSSVSLTGITVID